VSGAEILTFGCRLNAFESEVMRGHAGGQDDLVIVNTCAVTGEAERQARQAIRRVLRERPGARVVVTGCAAQIDPAAWASVPGVSRVLGNEEKLRAEAWADGGTRAPVEVGDIMAGGSAEPALVTEFAGRARAFVQVQTGCDHRCTFCIIPFGRGPSRSVPAGRVVEQIRTLVAGGCREIVLTGVDITSYGPDLPGRPTLGSLVRRILTLVPELERLRVSSIDPVEIDEELWAALGREDRLMPHLHLSLQAGSDLILKRMARRHLTADAARAIERARRLRPDIAIGADLIAGFPTETEALFEETLGFVRREAIPYLHVFPYSERPGTPAARMPAVPVAERRARAAALRRQGEANAQAYHASLEGSRIRVLIEKPGRGRSEHYAPVEIAGGQAGAIVDATVLSASRTGLVAA
jgi:threonylcarbamoyladenosine tRNA methylthiotransferase MtaB